jgi:hypothetical protein
MNTQMLEQVTEHVTEVRQSAGRCRRPAAAAGQPRESIRERAGWTLIHVGLKLTDPTARSQTARPRAASL